MVLMFCLLIRQVNKTRSWNSCIELPELPNFHMQEQKQLDCTQGRGCSVLKSSSEVVPLLPF